MIHEEKKCERCHSSGGSDPQDDAAMLAGQWTPYLKRQLEHFKIGRRTIPRKMKNAVDKLSEDEIEALYLTERRFFRLFIIFAILAIVIASLGILGLASFSVEQRTREIGIRKVSGSSGGSIILLISREFSILVLIANLFAWPIAWYFMRNWLMDFPLHIGLGIHFFILAALLALLIAMITVYIQGRRAALMDPARALRYE